MNTQNTFTPITLCPKCFFALVKLLKLLNVSKHVCFIALRMRFSTKSDEGVEIAEGWGEGY